MKIIKHTLLAFTATVMLVACKEKEVTPPANTPAETSADISIIFNNQVDGMPLELGKMQYTNAAGNNYQVDLLKYYITNVILVKDNNTELKLENYDLINAADISTCKVDALKVPNGTYTKIKFKVGLPYDRNHNGAQDGDLDPVMGMIWDWNTGYVFFKHEGKYKNTSGVTKSLTFHYATDRALTDIELPLTTSLKVEGVAKQLHLKFNLNNLYTTPTNVDFNTDNNRQSSSSADFAWIDNLKLSFSDAFIFDKIQ